MSESAGHHSPRELRQVFGKPLRESLAHANVPISVPDQSGNLSVWGYIPVVVAKCGFYLKENATELEGTFRMNDWTKRMQDLQAIFETPPRYGRSLDWSTQQFTAHDVATVFRRYLTHLPEPVIPIDMYHDFRNALTKNQRSNEEVIAAYSRLIGAMPSANRHLLLYVLDIFSVFARNADRNRMDAAYLAVIFRSCLLFHPAELRPREHALSRQVLETLIEHQDSFMASKSLPPQNDSTMLAEAESPGVNDSSTGLNLSEGDVIGLGGGPEMGRGNGGGRATPLEENTAPVLEGTLPIPHVDGPIRPASPRSELNAIQQWLDENLYHPDRQAKISLLLKFSAQYEGVLPTNLFIAGVSIGIVPAGGGSFADVYKGEYLGNPVAVKQFRMHLSNGPQDKLKKRFFREALMWRQLKHPRILPLLGIDKDALENKNMLTMISPWLPRGTLMEYLAAVETSFSLHCVLITDIAAGIEYLHTQALAHGDLHDSNVLIEDNGSYCHAILADFGLTAITDVAHMPATTTINRAGAMRWLAPELLPMELDGPPPRKTSAGDIFAFGRLCLTIYTRRVPFPTVHTNLVVIRVMNNEHPIRPSIEECYGSEMSDVLWELVTCCWISEPKARPDISAVIMSLEDAF